MPANIAGIKFQFFIMIQTIYLKVIMLTSLFKSFNLFKGELNSSLEFFNFGFNFLIGHIVCSKHTHNYYKYKAQILYQLDHQHVLYNNLYVCITFLVLQFLWKKIECFFELFDFRFDFLISHYTPNFLICYLSFCSQLYFLAMLSNSATLPL